MSVTLALVHDEKYDSSNAAKVAIGGRLDTATAAQLDEWLQPIALKRLRLLIFDLSELEFVTSAGIRVLMAARKSIVSRGGSCALVKMQPQVDRVLQIIKAIEGMKVFKNDDELDAYLTDIQRQVVDGAGDDEEG